MYFDPDATSNATLFVKVKDTIGIVKDDKPVPDGYLRVRGIMIIIISEGNLFGELSVRVMPIDCGL